MRPARDHPPAGATTGDDTPASYDRSTQTRRPEPRALPEIYGAFSASPLTHEQLRVVALANQDEDRLCTVAGSADARATSTCLALIASRVTARALAILEGRDRGMGLLVTAASDRALELAQALEADPATGAYEGFWIRMEGGAKAGCGAAARARIDRAIERIREAPRSPDAFRHARQTLLDGRARIDAARRKHAARRARIDAALIEVGCPAGEGLDDARARCAQAMAAEREALSSAGITTGLTDDHQLLALADALAHLHPHFAGYQAVPGVTLPAAIAVATAPAAIAALQAAFAHYPQRQPGKLLAATAYRSRWQRTLATVIETLPPGPARDALAPLSPAQAAALGARLAQVNPADLTALQGLARTDAEAIETLRQTTERLAPVRAQQARMAAAKQALAALDPEARQLAGQDAAQSWLEELNSHFADCQRAMLEAACTLLYEYALVYRNETLIALQAFAAHAAGTAAPDASATWAGRTAELARMVSMVYPVVITSGEAVPALSLLPAEIMAGQPSYELVLIRDATTAVDSTLALGARALVWAPAPQKRPRAHRPKSASP